MRIVESKLNGAKVAYELDAGYNNYDKKGSAPLCVSITQYETFGDGTTKHSNSWCAQFHELTDVCLSFAAAIMAEPRDKEHWHVLSHLLNRWNKRAMEFALSVKFKEGKEQWYSLVELKVSSSESKRNDRRYEKVESWHVGGPVSALNILLKERNLDWIERMILAYRLREMQSDLDGWYVNWEELFKPTAELKGDWFAALRAFISALEMVQAIDTAEILVENALSQATRKEEEQTAA